MAKTEHIEDEIEIDVEEDPLRISLVFEDGTEVDIALAIPAKVKISA
jgi:hypothetical protein